MEAQIKDSINFKKRLTIDDTSKPLSDLSLLDLSQIKVTIASKTSLTLNESPGIITLISKDEILTSGARDLIDVLRLVPGIEFGIDVRGVTTIGIRGNWAIEGKALLLWDGQIMNEMLFQSTQLGNHYPVDLIDRIEIIRGPGSAIYGGNAEFGVINIITTQTSDLSGTEASLSFGWMKNACARKNIALSIGDKQDNLEIDFSIFTGSANRSDQIMTDYYNDNPYHAFQMPDQEALLPLFLNAGIKYGLLKTRFIMDNYRVYDRTMYGINLKSPVLVDFNFYIADLQYEYSLGDKMKLTPRFTYTRNTTWRCLNPSYSMPIYLDKTAARHALGLNFSYDINPSFSILSGIEFYRDQGEAADRSFYNRNPKNKEISYNNTAAFFQGLYLSKIINLTIGARLENNSEVGTSFVPRFAFTKFINNFHFKILYSFAFRSSSIENLSRYSNTPVKPEKTTVFEIEAGYDILPNMTLNANIFDINVNNPNIFSVDPVMKVSAYSNSTRTGSSGIEAEIRYKCSDFFSCISYSFYTAGKNEGQEYKVSEDNDILLCFPKHKIALNMSYYFKNGFSLNTTGTYLSDRYFDNAVAAKQEIEQSKFLFNLFLRSSDLFIPNLSFGLGIYDFFNVRYSFIQPYNGGIAPLPGPTREILFKLSYSL